MDWDKRTERRLQPHTCNPDTCQYHYLTENVIADLKDAVKQLLEGQGEMRDTVIQLVEQQKSFDRLADRLEKLEDLQRDKDEKQDGKIQELRAFMYKAMGAIGVLGLAVGFVSKILLGV